MLPPAVGSQVPMWFSGSPDGMSTVLEVMPYRGRYTSLFHWTVKVTALRTKRGWVEYCL